jgi:hypothetical protein
VLRLKALDDCKRTWTQQQTSRPLYLLHHNRVQMTCVHRGQRVVDGEGEMGKHLTRRGFETWAKRFPAVATTMRSLLAIGAAAAPDSTDSTAGTASSRGAGNSARGTSARVQLPPVPQLISLHGFSAASCLLRPEWAWAISASGKLSAQVPSLCLLVQVNDRLFFSW